MLVDFDDYDDYGDKSRIMKMWQRDTNDRLLPNYLTLDIRPIDPDEWTHIAGNPFECSINVDREKRNGKLREPCGFKWFALDSSDRHCPACGMRSGSFMLNVEMLIYPGQLCL